MDLKAATVLITGASRGIGRGIAIAFAKQGSNIAINYRLNKDAAEKTQSMVRDIGVDSDIFCCDVGDTKGSRQMAADVIERFGGIDVLVNNGAVNQGRGEGISEADWDELMRINLRGVYFLSEAVLKHMRPRKSGRIVNMSSTTALRGSRGSAHYITSKAALIGMTKAMATNEAKNGIRINALAVGAVETDMIAAFTQNFSEEQRRIRNARIPLGRPAEAEEMGEVVVFMAKHDYMNGETICPSGGAYMR